MAGNQRMAGEVWRTYDVKKIGNDNFDDADLNHLLKQGWSHNDILKVAAAAGRVDSSTDQRLRKLNTEKVDTRKMSKETLKKMFKQGDEYALAASDVVYLGGDKNDPRSYKSGGVSLSRGVANQGRSSGAGRSDEDSYYEPPTQWKAPKKNDRTRYGDESEVLTWRGLNADGGANALEGTRVEKDKDWYKTRNVTWRVPDDYLNSRAEQVESKQEEPQTAPPPVGVSERFNPAKYALNTPSYTPSYGLNLSSDSNSQEGVDSTTRATPLFDYVTRGVRDPRGLDKSISSLSSYIG